MITPGGRRFALAALAAGLLTMTACSGDDDVPGTPTPTGPGTSSSVPTSSRPPATTPSGPGTVTLPPGTTVPVPRPTPDTAIPIPSDPQQTR